MSLLPAIDLRYLGAAALRESLAEGGAPHLPLHVLSDHCALGNAALHRALQDKVARLLDALRPRLADTPARWGGAPADVLALDLALVESTRRPFDLAWVEIQAFTSMLPTCHSLHLAQRRLHGLPASWLPHDPGTIDWVERMRPSVAPHGDTVLIEDRPRERLSWHDFQAARHWWGVDVCDWREVAPAGGHLRHAVSGRRYRHVLNRLITTDLHPADRRHAEALLQGADRVGWHSHPAWYERIDKGTLAELALDPHEACHWVEACPSAATGWRDSDAWVAKAVAAHSGGGLLLRPTAEALAALPRPRRWIVQRRFRQRPAGVHPLTGMPLYAEIRCVLMLGPARPWVAAWMVRLSTDGVATMTGRRTLPGEGASLLYFDTAAGGRSPAGAAGKGKFAVEAAGA